MGTCTREEKLGYDQVQSELLKKKRKRAAEQIVYINIYYTTLF